jgi:putative ABC transport system substrate-binding protein
MRRFSATVSVLLVVLLVFASAAATQPAPKVARIGMLCAPSCNSNDDFLDELRKLGWVEGTTIVIERKDPDYHLDQLPALAADLVRSKPNLIVAITPQSARAAKDATSDIPIVMLFVADPVGVGLASSLAHPGGNLTGVATLVPGDFGGKGLDILREALPQAKRLAVIINPSNEIHRRLFPMETKPAAAKLGFQLDLIEVREAGRWRHCRRQSPGSRGFAVIC